jgi:3-hydroxyacyl-[acyl-carrier-protein] dehydratase
MSTAQASSSPAAGSAVAATPGGDPAARQDSAGNAKRFLFSLDGIDLSKRLLDRQQLEKWNPHRGQMALLDHVVWYSDDFKRGVAIKHVRDDEFWVPGHFPGRPMLPGVLMIESGAQLATFLYNVRFPEPRIAAFVRLDEATFRTPVVPGDDLYLVCQEVKFTPRRFSSDIQGLVDGKVAFDARITGMAV